jgi:lipoprotein signal peptidase
LGLFVFIIYSWRSLPEKEKIGYTLIFTGWLLNAIERSIFGSVTDMVSVQYFAIFNIADIAVTCGVWLLLITSILCKKEEPLKSCK